MPWSQAASFQLTLLVAMLGATCLAGGMLALECFASKTVARRAPGVMVALLATLAVAAWCWQPTLWMAEGCGGLALLLLLAWPIHFESARAHIGRLARPKVVWAAMLGVSLIAARYLAAGVLSSFDLPPPREVDLADVPVRATEAITDKGRAISLFHFKMYSTATEVEQFIETNEKDRAQLIRLLAANPASNCHGWVFTSGQYGIRDTDVAAILTDNDYLEVHEPREGDLAVYTAHDQKICHSGLVRIANKHEPLLIESKWGPFGVYLHAVKAQPFSAECKFYRSPRESHVLALRRSPTASETVSLALPNRRPNLQ
jgi:hypothetical protein